MAHATNNGFRNEEQFLQAVIALARTLGYKPYHTRDSRRSNDGWPDLCLVRPPETVFLELKMPGRTLTPAQRAWLKDLQACGREAYVCLPKGLGQSDGLVTAPWEGWIMNGDGMRLNGRHRFAPHAYTPGWVAMGLFQLGLMAMGGGAAWLITWQERHVSEPAERLGRQAPDDDALTFEDIQRLRRHRDEQMARAKAAGLEV